MAAKYVEVLPATLSSKHNALNFVPGEVAGSGLLTLMTTNVVEYRVHEFGNDFHGRSFKLTKLASEDTEDESYAVFVGDHETHCDCKGYAYGRGKPCKHIEAVRSLLSNHWL